MRKEPAGLALKDGKCPDGCTLLPWRGGKRLAWDVTVCTTVADSYVANSSQSAGSFDSEFGVICDHYVVMAA